MDSSKLLDMVIGFVLNECKGEDGKVDVDEAVETLGDLWHALTIHMMKLSVFNSLGKAIDEYDGNLVITATPINKNMPEPKPFSEYLEECGYELVDSDGDSVSNSDLTSLIDDYLEEVKA